ncbi:MAG: hypothetical protein QOF70_3358 [Acetobacteraceae bacterium]|jgi:hypothetical protein|nr:hypothetical protein [Acetobacteraceae bacterium]
MLPWPGQHVAGVELSERAPELHPGGFPERLLAAGAGELAHRCPPSHRGRHRRLRRGSATQE